MSWIKINDSEPVLGQMVLSYSRDCGIIVAKYTTFQKGSIGHLEGRSERWFEYITNDNCAMRHNATHWMPIMDYPA